MTTATLSGRDAYKDELAKLAETEERIVCLEADLGGKNHPFQTRHPERFLNLGIAELAGVDIAAGLAEAGYVPFISTFAAFAALRAAESVKLSLGYMGKNVKLVAPYGGVSGGWFGTTHHALEDIAVIQSFQNIRIACPHGEEETRRVIREAAASTEPYYIRLSRNDAFESLARASASSCRELLVERGAVHGRAKLCLLSVGEQATELCKALTEQFESVVHAHACYVDSQSLKAYVEPLQSLADRFLVVEEHRATGGTASYLALIMPEHPVYSHNCGEQWPMYGGSHAEVLADLGFGLEPLRQQIQSLLGGSDDI
ncbi:Transketolase central region [Paenibacillus curdlanolyticus YK9]|uniref:Transketolase central region n=1 Tax=Paenibacillus curdlanolyticus YK9 TaxID=717606 RepID=E0IE66_9BACL|nr:transketolase [Paenibacillus curdlanolyticus]EFM09420.1 Transketolase central region [Paenibacillus curdlanolyticus YK9]